MVELEVNRELLINFENINETSNYEKLFSKKTQF
jgi:hypothetical protein